MDHNATDTPANAPTHSRTRRRVAIVVIVVAVLGLLAGAAWVIWMRDDPPIEAADSPTPEASAEPSPEPTEEEPPEAPPIVALTTAGDLLLLDPDTGATLQVITEGLPMGFLPSTLTVTPDRATAYYDTDSGYDDSPPYQDPWHVVRVSLVDGTSEVFADGHYPSVSPDGGTLAYGGPDPNAPGSDVTGINFLDVQSGTVRHLSSNVPSDAGRQFGQPVWSTDGSQVFVYRGSYDALDLVVVEVATATDLEDALILGPPDTVPPDSWYLPALLADGRLAFAGLAAGPDSPSESRYVGVLDLAAGEVVMRVDELDGFQIWNLAPHPHEFGLAIVMSSFEVDTGGHPHLYRWDEDGGLRLLREDILAVAW